MASLGVWHCSAGVTAQIPRVRGRAPAFARSSVSRQGHRCSHTCQALPDSGDSSMPDAASPASPASAAHVATLTDECAPPQGRRRPIVAGCYTAMAVTSAVLGLLSMLAPNLLLDRLAGAVGGGVSPLDVPLLRMAGATLGISAFAEGSLAQAARDGALASSQSRFLSLAILLKSCMYLLAFALVQQAWTPALIALYPSAALVSIALNAYTLTSTSDGSTEPSSRSSSSKQAPTQQASRFAVFYGTYALVMLVRAAQCYMPEAMYPGMISPVGQLLKYTCAPGYFLCAAVSYLLRDAHLTGTWKLTSFGGLLSGLIATESGAFAVLVASMMSGVPLPNTYAWIRSLTLLLLLGVCAYSFMWPALARRLGKSVD